VNLSAVNSDTVYGNVARTFLPQMIPGLLGVFLAALLAGVMSSCDSFMISAAGLFTENIYKPARPGKSNRHYMLAARITAILVVAGGLAFAYWTPDVVTALETWLKIAPMVGIAFWMGLLWRRGTVAGAWAATLTGFGAWFLATRDSVVRFAERLPFAEPLRLIWHEAGKEPEVYEPWVILFYMVAATFAGVLVSLFTRPVRKEKLDRFYALTRTPIQPGEQVEEPCTLPEGVTTPPRRMLLTAFGLEIPAPSRVSVIGFIAGWLGVAALIVGFLLLVRL
jgi:Na+/proline symporter